MVMQNKVVERATGGFIFRLASFWVGVHYSDYNRRFCVNPIPCVTVWVALAGGKRP